MFWNSNLRVYRHVQPTTDVIVTSTWKPTTKSAIVLKKLLFRGASNVLTSLHEKKNKKKKQVQVLWRVFAMMTHIK